MNLTEQRALKLQFLEHEYSVCRLDADTKIPSWAHGEFLSIVRTDNELSIVAKSKLVPGDVKAQRGFACFRVTAELDFDVIGVIAGISSVLAVAKVAILSVSTYDTDYFLIPGEKRETATAALIEAGYEFQTK